MEHSFSKVRCSSAAFLLAAGITVAACGDDSGGTTPTPSSDAGLDSGGNPSHDGGGSSDGGPMDGGVTPTPDAATAPDAAAELAAALDPAGVVASLRRAELVYTAVCAHGKECQVPDGLNPQCASRLIEDYKSVVAENIPDACLDAVLDLWGCIAHVACDDFQEAKGCSALNDTYGNICGPYMNTDAGI